MRKRQREKEKHRQSIREEQKQRELLDQRLKEINEKLGKIDSDKEELGLIADKIEVVLEKMEKNRLHKYLELIENKRKLIWINLLIGMSKGLGTLIGVTLITALFIYILQQLISLNIPVIGDFISEIVRIVQDNLRNAP